MRLSRRRLYQAPRVNLEYPGLAWLKHLRSASSRAAAKALQSGNGRRTAHQRMIGLHGLFVNELEFDLQGLPQDLDGLRLVHLTDIHHGPWMPVEFVRDIVDMVNSLKPDIVALTGDYVVNSPRYIMPVAHELGRLTPRFGTVAVLGNHDWWEGGDQVRAALRSVGVQVIDNSRCFLTAQGRLNLSRGVSSGARRAGLWIGGVGDCWTDSVDLRKALKGIPQDHPCLVLSHNPEVAEDPCLISGEFRVDLMLSGHTHGGQVRPHLLGAKAVRPRRRLRHAHGLVNGPACPVYISRGIGTAGLPLRINMPPEIALFRLRSTTGPTSEGYD